MVQEVLLFLNNNIVHSKAPMAINAALNLQSGATMCKNNEKERGT